MNIELIAKKINKLNELRKKQDENIKALMQSVLLKSMWDDVFDHKPLKIRIEGAFNCPSKLKYVVEGKDETRSFNIAEVPRPLIRSILKDYGVTPYQFYHIVRKSAPDPFNGKIDED